MKLSLTLPLSALLLFSLSQHAGAQDHLSSTMTQPPTVRYVKLTVKSLKLWPVKVSGKCWDPCFGKRYPMPTRDSNKKYTDYFKHKTFQQACSGRKAPDPYVQIKIGRYEVFTTAKQNNQCQSRFNVGHVFRVGQNDALNVSVYDHDTVLNKHDIIGKWKGSVLPPQLLAGGTFTLKRFGQVEELVLESTPITSPAPSCEGVYQVRIAEYNVNAKKENGKSWDRGLKRFSRPDVLIELKIGNNTLTTPKIQDKTQFVFLSGQKTIPIKKRSSVSLTVYDKDMFGRKETIGQTAMVDVCKMINAKGLYTFTSFGQVNKVVILFRKMK